MGVVLQLTSISDSRAVELMLTAHDDVSQVVTSATAPTPEEFAAWYLARQAAGEIVEPFSTELDLDTACVLAYLLSGDPAALNAPQNFLLGGGGPAQSLDLGFGPGWALRGEDVVRARDAVESMNEQRLRSEFLKSHPSGIEGNVGIDDVLHALAQLRSFIREAVRREEGLSLHLG